MNALIRRTIVIGSCWGLLPLHAEEVLQPVEASQAPASGNVRILGDIPDGTPAPPPDPKPRLVFQPEDVLTVRTKELGERLVTFQKVAPIALPPIPEPVPSQAVELDPELAAQAREYYQKRQFVFLGASAFVSAADPEKPRSYVRIWPNRPNAEPIGLWVNANFLWLTGFAEVEAGDTIYSLLMVISPTNVDNLSRIASRHQEQTGASATSIPEFDDSLASFVVTEGTPVEGDLAPITALVELYNKDKERLRSAYERRMEAAAARARELRENPPAKKDIVVRYWRLDQAGQAGANPKPATIR